MNYRYHSFSEEIERQLHANAPNVIEVAGWRSDLEDAGQRLGAALHNNTHVEALSLELHSLFDATEDLTLLLRFIERSTSLKCVVLHYNGNPLDTRSQQFLISIGRNNLIPTVELWSMGIPVDLFAAMMTNIINLNLTNVTIHEPSVGSMEDTLGRALKSVERLRLWRRFTNPTWTEILRSMSQHTALQELTVEGIFGEDESRALGDLLRANSGNLQEVCFQNKYWGEETAACFTPIVEGLQSNSVMITLSFEHCTLAEAPTQQLLSLFQSDIVRRNLKINCRCNFHSETYASFLEELLACKGLASLDLREQLHFWRRQSREEYYTNFRLVIDRLSSTTCLVESVVFPPLNPDWCKYLIQKLPSFKKLRRLSVDLDEFDCSHWKDALLEALRHNGSLWYVEIEATFLNEDDRVSIRWFSRRNQKLPPLITSLPEMIQQSIRLWPTMFRESAATGGHDDAFRAMLNLGGRVGRGGNKRKRLVLETLAAE